MAQVGYAGNGEPARLNDISSIVSSYENIKERLGPLASELNSHVERMRGGSLEKQSASNVPMPPRAVRLGHLGKLEDLAEDIGVILDSLCNSSNRLNSIG